MRHPRRTISFTCASVRLRLCAQIARALECVATNGFSAVSNTSSSPASLRCETSTNIPQRSISRTAARPKSVRPRSVTLPEPSSFSPFHVSVTAQTPWRFSFSMRDRSPANALPFSTLRKAAVFPAAQARSMSATLRQGDTRLENFCIWRSKFSCDASKRRTASSPRRRSGRKTAKNCAQCTSSGILESESERAGSSSVSGISEAAYIQSVSVSQ